MTISSDRGGARRLLAIALALGIGAWGARAQAEPSAADLVAARTLFKEGESRRASGDLRGALEPLRRAHELAHTPITGVELGGVYAELGRLVEARDVWREVSRMPETPNESAATKRARADVSARQAPLEARIPSVRIVIQGPVETVTIDGQAVPVASLGERISLDPGAHTIFASAAGGASRTARIDLAESVQSQVLIDLGAGASSPAIVVGPSPTHGAPPPEHPSRALFWTGVGVAGVGLAVGGITGGLALAKKSDVAAACPDKLCPASAQSDIDASKSFGTVSTVAFVVAGVGAAVAIVSFLVTRPERHASAGAARWMTFTARGWEGTF